jgi:hypothetical protein
MRHASSSKGKWLGKVEQDFRLCSSNSKRVPTSLTGGNLCQIKVV